MHNATSGRADLASHFVFFPSETHAYPSKPDRLFGVARGSGPDLRPDNILCCCNRPSAAGAQAWRWWSACVPVWWCTRRPWRWAWRRCLPPGGGIHRAQVLWCGLSGLPGLAGAARASGRGLRGAHRRTSDPGPQPGRMVGRGMVMNLTNPGALVFFPAFLPQFADPARGALRCS